MKEIRDVIATIVLAPSMTATSTDAGMSVSLTSPGLREDEVRLTILQPGISMDVLDTTRTRPGPVGGRKLMLLL